MRKYIIEVVDSWKPKDCGNCFFDCGDACFSDDLICPLAKAQEVVEVPASKEALLIWLGNSELKIFAAKEDK